MSDRTLCRSNPIKKQVNLCSLYKVHHLSLNYEFCSSVAGIMLLEVFLVLGTVIIYLLFTKKKEETLRFKEGWWGKGQKPDTEEDTTIRPFKVETTEEELSVSKYLYWGERSMKWLNKCRTCSEVIFKLNQYLYLWE